MQGIILACAHARWLLISSRYGVVCLVNSKPEGNGHAILTTTGSDAFTAADLAKIRLVDGMHSAASVRLKLSADNKSILCKRCMGMIISFH